MSSTNVSSLVEADNPAGMFAAYAGGAPEADAAGLVGVHAIDGSVLS